jgi:hypothetical protein
MKWKYDFGFFTFINKILFYNFMTYDFLSTFLFIYTIHVVV